MSSASSSCSGIPFPLLHGLLFVKGFFAASKVEHEGFDLVVIVQPDEAGRSKGSFYPGIEACHGVAKLAPDSQDLTLLAGIGHGIRNLDPVRPGRGPGLGLGLLFLALDREDLVALGVGDVGRTAQRTVSTRILMKKLTPAEIRAYVASHNWEGACGYKIEDMEAYVKKMIGSYSGVIGLPLYETRNLLNGIGVK